MSQESDDLLGEGQTLTTDGFVKVREVLGKIGCQKYFSKFKEQELTDDALQYAEEKKVMQDLLTHIIPLGPAFKFTSCWFQHKTALSSIKHERDTDDHVHVQSNSPRKGVQDTPFVRKADEDNSAETSSNADNCDFMAKFSEETERSTKHNKTSCHADNKPLTEKLETTKEVSSGTPSKQVFLSDEPKLMSTAAESSNASSKEKPNVFNENPEFTFCSSQTESEKVTEVSPTPQQVKNNSKNSGRKERKDKQKQSKKKQEPSNEKETTNSGSKTCEDLSELESSAVANSPADCPAEDSLQENSNDVSGKGDNTPDLGLSSDAKNQELAVVKLNVSDGGDLAANGAPLQGNTSKEGTVGSCAARIDSFVEVDKCPPRGFGIPVSDFHYINGNVLTAEENREVEFKSLTDENMSKLPWKIMEKARLFICGVLNSGGKGTIYFGIGDSYNKKQQFRRGEIVGLAVEELKDEITRAFQVTLDSHIKSDKGNMQKAGDMKCVTVYFVPVFESDQPTGRYVIEVEVQRDWIHCQEKVYYFNSWTPNANAEQKGAGLKNWYTVGKQKWQEPVIRTCGETCRISNIDVEKEIKEPLSEMYKKFRDDAKRNRPGSLPSLASGNVEEKDVAEYSTKVRESLRGLNFKEVSYILFANKVSSEHRGATSLSFLKSVPYMAVFDLFDHNSRSDGLYHIFNETNDSAPVTVKDLSEFKNVLPSEDLPTRGTTWIERNKPMQESNWTRNSKDCLYRALSAYHAKSPTGRIHCLFLLFTEESIQEVTDIIDCAFSIIGEKAGKSITVISEKKEIADEVVRCSKQDIRKEVKERTASGYPWKLLERNFRQMVGPSKFNDRDATTDLPFFDGSLQPVLTRRLNSLTDLEVYCPYPTLPGSVEEIEKARYNFYKGGVVDQLNLFHDHDIKRTHQKKLTSQIEKYLTSLSGKEENPCYVEIVQLRYESGSGGTTLCRRILWNQRVDYRCAVVKAISAETDFQIQTLQNVLYNTDHGYVPPVLLLVDNFPDQDVRQLLDKISERKIKCVILNTVPISKLLEGEKDDPVVELRKLDRSETEKVKRVLVDVTRQDEERRSAAEKVLERERRFIWLGLELFGRQYKDIDQRLVNHINDIISQNLKDDSKNSYEMILRFCCLLDYYSKGRCNYPHACLTDIICNEEEERDDMPNRIKWLHDKFGGLLLESFDESKGFRGWRPAHYLVGEVVRQQMDLLVTTNEFLTKMNDGEAYARTYLKDHAVTICLDREIKSGDTSSQGDVDDETIPIDDMCGALEVRTRYSPLIEDVIKSADDSKQKIGDALDILITLLENVSKVQHKARTWQQIARIVAYEIGMKTIPSDDRQIGRINALLRPCHIRDLSTNGFEIAHLVIDEAIKLQDSYVHHLVTKGAFFMAELREMEETFTIAREITNIIREAISTGMKGIAVYEDALKKIPYGSYGYLDAMVGKFQAVVRLLEILKRHPFFTQHHLGPDESFKVFMNDSIEPEKLGEIFSKDDIPYFVSLKEIAVDLSLNLLEEIHFVKLRRTPLSKKYVQRELRNANARALFLSKKFYQLTRLQPGRHAAKKSGFQEVTVHHILSQHNETPFSTWKTLSEANVKEIYETLQLAIQNGTLRDKSMLVYARAALHLQEKPSLRDLMRHVDLWCKMFPRSVWAHLFNYMLHFPLESSALDTNVELTNESIRVCTENSRSREYLRKSSAEYLLGNGRGLKAIVRPYEVSEDSNDIHGTKFWQSNRVFKKLARLRGRKISGRKGVLNYRGIEILFDNQRYPKDSSDDLWFCLGFTLNGPYAYDPIDDDSYNELKASLLSKSSAEDDVPSPSRSVPADFQSSTRYLKDVRVKNVLKNEEPFDSFRDTGVGSAVSSPRLIAEATPVGANTAETSCSSKSAQPPRKKVSANTKEGNVFTKPSRRFQNEATKITDWAQLSCNDWENPHSNDWGDSSGWTWPKSSDWTQPGRSDWAGVDSIDGTQPDIMDWAGPDGSDRAQPKEDKSLKSMTIAVRKKDGDQISFPCTRVDRNGRVCHGATVVGALKSAECNQHLSRSAPENCNFAHSWKGDTLEFVCEKCTKAEQDFCNKKVEHAKYIHNLGPYRNRRNELWVRKAYF